MSCESPQKKAVRQLSERGIEPTGKALLDAVTSGDSSTARLLIEAGVHTGHRDEAGRTPLQLAINGHDVGTALLLLAPGHDDLDVTDANGVSALGYALEAKETAVADRLLDEGAKVEGVMPDGEELLPWAIREGRLAFVRHALEKGADPHGTDRNGDSLAQVAMRHGRQEVLSVLLDRGADAASVDAQGMSLLHRAMEKGWLDLVPRLLKAGADPNLADAKGRTPVEEAIRLHDPKLLSMFLGSGGDPNFRNKSGDSPVNLVMRAAWPEGRALLAKAGADFSRADHAGKTPLAYAMEVRDCDLAVELIAYGAKPMEGGWARWLSRALVTGDTAMVHKLLAMGVKADARDRLGRLPVEAAALSGQGSMVRALVDAGAPVGNSLYLTCATGNGSMARLLMACGVSPNPSHAPWLDTPLGAAIRSGDEGLVTSLLQRGANPFIRTAEGQLPLNLAIALRRPAVVAMLLKLGANPNIPCLTPVRSSFLKHVKSSSMRYVLKEDRNVTPLMLAAASGEVATTLHLLKAGANKNITTRETHFWPINFASFVGDVRMMRVMLGRDPWIEERVIVVSLSEQRARVYNQYGEEIYTTKVSTGKPGFATKTGEFAITDKNRQWKSTLYHAEMPFFQRLSGDDFGLHEGVVPGYPASHGCIRVPSGNAQKLFSMTQTGDRVKIVP
ncbi:ankyrin repeat domain-containing protein [Luteolibacter ambystomatis]|uniref:Ankyrin repeat domain-containing protein n=1 Tax=Luteolibacter ambystomatis TaxID=2824561 RepID=A0A975IZ31_9BACT|nr:ankyrin repeat domain-containing protein [Luteolibacter ambystomatis]QUE50503.1 ankyrin repeat domain-containing protein [Luteolibacter ambystomatis]